MNETFETPPARAKSARRWLATVRWLALSLRLPFVFVYVIGLTSEVGDFWRLAPSTATLLAAAFTTFGLLGTISFGFVRALPADAVAEARIGLAAGRRAFHAAVLALAGLLVVHGWTEGWPGMKLLGSFWITDLLVRALFVVLGVGTASEGMLAIWQLDALLTRPANEPQ